MLTNSHYISEDGFQFGSIAFPEKYSYREEKRRRDGYRLRLYWQFKETLQKGGMVVFDTLTYDDVCLPRVNQFIDTDADFSCFCPDDVRLFFYRLVSAGYKFKKFLTSEYGSSSLYRDNRGRLRKATHRPHYHVLFFFDEPVVPEKFAADVYRLWSKGRTDNYAKFVYDGRMVALKNFITSSNCDVCRVVKLSNYLSKYVLKDAAFDRKVDEFIRSFLGSSGRDYFSRKAYNHDFRELKSRIGSFIRISKNFGTALLDDADAVKQVYSSSTCRIPDRRDVWRIISLPTYYLRKMFYKCMHGKWELTDKGKSFIGAHWQHRAKRLSNVYEQAFVNSDYDTREAVLDLMAGRTWQDLADYVVYYKGRICNPAKLSQMPSIDDVVKSFVSAKFDIFRDPLHKTEFYSRREVRETWFWNDKLLMSAPMSDVWQRKRCVALAPDWRAWIIGDGWFESHYGFDAVLELLMPYMFSVTNKRQGVYSKVTQLSLKFHNDLSLKTKV